jgi:hypothetical protein
MTAAQVSTTNFYLIASWLLFYLRFLQPIEVSDNFDKSNEHQSLYG